jgi:predicted metal-binding membrane protein
MMAPALYRPVRGTAGLVALLLGLAAAGWGVTRERMTGMDAGPGSELGDVGWFAISWLLMMAAMMLPAITPMVVAHSRRSASVAATAAFAAGYLVAWVVAGLLGYAVVEGVRSLEPAFLAWEEAGRYVAGVVIAGAGLYQLMRPKRACLRRCRDRHAFIRERWSPGGLGALRMGGAHGAICVGCSWALMAALLALGAMSLTWMALVAAAIAAERLLPGGDAPRRAVAVVLLALGTGVALVPGDVPGLTIPQPEMGMS